MLPRSCDVVLPLPAAEPYSYRVPESLAERVLPGARVVVPVRSREMVGVVCRITAEPGEGLKSVVLAPDPVPLVPRPLLELAHWMSRYYATPLGLALRSILPGALWGKSRVIVHLEDPKAAGGGASRNAVRALESLGGRTSARTLGRRLARPMWNLLQRMSQAGVVRLETEPPDTGPAAGIERYLVLTRSLPSLLERKEVFGRAHRQLSAYETLDSLGGEAPLKRLKERYGYSTSVIKGLTDKGLAEVQARSRMRDPFGDVGSRPPGEPTDSQHEAVAAICRLTAGSAGTLFGVTGSGKTLVYLEAIRRRIADDGGAIILVPEISLTPQTIARVRGVFGDEVAVLHSALSDGERADAWRALADGSRRVAVGARSAVFAPVRDLRVVVVDEEHDGSYKNGESPRYHARDVARRRAALEGAVVVLSSATPALETWAAEHAIIRLPRRAGTARLPDVRLIDLRSSEKVRGALPVPWSLELDEMVEARLIRDEQIILLLNRRGFANYLQCEECGEVVGCPDCSIALTLHRTPPRLFCHYCGYHMPAPDACPHCSSPTHRSRGIGTQLVERWLSERYPEARLARMDADTTSTRWSHNEILDRFRRRQVDVLFGTQMIAKGLDFPDVTLVGVIDADTGLHLPDFRAAERTFQLVTQVSGRSGRGGKAGEVIVQTRRPDHYALGFAARHNYESFARRELEVRRDPPYPPHVNLANLLVSGDSETAVSDAAMELGDWMRGLVAARATDRASVVGPAPAPLARIKRKWRWHLLLRSPDAGLLGRLLRYTAERGPHRSRPGIRLVLDRDPVSLL